MQERGDASAAWVTDAGGPSLCKEQRCHFLPLESPQEVAYPVQEVGHRDESSWFRTLQTNRNDEKVPRVVVERHRRSSSVQNEP